MPIFSVFWYNFAKINTGPTFITPSNFQESIIIPKASLLQNSVLLERWAHTVILFLNIQNPWGKNAQFSGTVTTVFSHSFVANTNSTHSLENDVMHCVVLTLPITDK